MRSPRLINKQKKKRRGEPPTGNRRWSHEGHKRGGFLPTLTLHDEGGDERSSPPSPLKALREEMGEREDDQQREGKTSQIFSGKGCGFCSGFPKERGGRGKRKRGACAPKGIEEGTREK